MISMVLLVALWGCQNETIQVQPNTSNSNAKLASISTKSNLDSTTTKSDTIYISDDWKDDTIQLGEDYDLVRFVEITTDEAGKLVGYFDKKLTYKDGNLQSSVLGDLVYNEDGQIISVSEGQYYRAGKIFSDATYDARGWLLNVKVGSSELSPMGNYGLEIINAYDIEGKLKTQVSYSDTINYLYSIKSTFPEMIVYNGIFGRFNVSYKFIKKDSLTYNSIGQIEEVYFSNVGGPTSTSSINLHSPKFELTSKTEYSGYRMGKAAKFMIWYDLTRFEELYNYIYLPPNIIEIYTNGYFFSYRKMVFDYTLDQSTFKTNAKGDVIEVKRVKTVRDGRKFNVIQRFKYGNI